MYRPTPLALLCLGLLAGCNPEFKTFSCKDVSGDCTQVSASDPLGLLDAVNSLSNNTTVVLGSGHFKLGDQVTIRADGITLQGQGMGDTILDFFTEAAQSNGVDAVGTGLTFKDFTISDAKKDGLRVEASDRVVIDGVEGTWTYVNDSTNGAYGLYPVSSTNVLLQNSSASNASDAGIYVGQCQHVIVQNNEAYGNVAGLEIENTEYADVHNNHVHDNTGGLLVFDLPGNPIVGRDIDIHDNTVENNNDPNFAPSGVVRGIPAGTGTFAMASRRVEIHSNTYTNNGTVDVAVLSGLAIEPDTSQWAEDPSGLSGDYQDLNLPSDGTYIYNYLTTSIYVHDNTHSGGGTNVDAGQIQSACLTNPNGAQCTRPLAVLIKVTYGTTPVDADVYDTIGESSFDATSASGNSDDNHICIGPNEPSFASLDLPALSAATPPTLSMVYRPDSPFTPFDCSDLTGGPLATVTVQAP